MKIVKFFGAGCCLGLLALNSACATLQPIGEPFKKIERKYILSKMLTKTVRFINKKMLSDGETYEGLIDRGFESFYKYKALKDTQPEIAKNHLESAAYDFIITEDYGGLNPCFKEINNLDFDVNKERTGYVALYLEILKSSYLPPLLPEEIKDAITDRGIELLAEGKYDDAFFRFLSIGDYARMSTVYRKARYENYNVKKCLEFKNIKDKLLYGNENPSLEDLANYFERLELK